MHPSFLSQYILLLLSVLLLGCRPVSSEVAAVEDLPSTSNELERGTLGLMTYNIRYATPNDGEDQWALRKTDVVELVQRHQPAVLGIQEGLLAQLTFLDTALADYSYLGRGRDEDPQAGEFSAIFYDTSRLRALHTETFWLSSTPAVFSVGWDASMQRICTYGVFYAPALRDTLHVFNAHFDHVGPEAREKSAQLLIQKVEDYGLRDKMVVVMGDFNAVPASPAIEYLASHLTDGREGSSASFSGPEGTFSGFQLAAPLTRRIDYIFTNDLVVKSYRHIADRRPNGRWPSDHLPVMVEVMD
ncbi:MAG: endonuclease/exonuclease/phosphatase family protein [Bacteroidota bacterium]